MTDVLRVIDIMPDEAKHLAQKLHRKKDEIELHRKALVGAVEDASDEERTLVARVSTNDRDRDGEIVEPKGIDLKDFAANPVLCWAHKYDVPPVGKALWSKTDDKGLVCKFQFAQTQFAEDIYQLYKGGYLRAFSIGFIPTDYDSKEKVHKRISLLEVSAVPVPANQSALVMEAYTKGVITSDALKRDLGIEAEAVPAEDTVVPAEDTAKAEVEAIVDNILDLPGDAVEASAAMEAGEAVAEKVEDEPAVEAPEADGEAIVLDANIPQLDALTATVEALKAEFVALRDLLLEKAVAPAPEPAPTVEAEPCKPEPEGSTPSAGSTIRITAADPEPKSAAEELLDFVRSDEFREMVRLEVDKSIGRVR